MPKQPPLPVTLSDTPENRFQPQARRANQGYHVTVRIPCLVAFAEELLCANVRAELVGRSTNSCPLAWV